jgi:hypothetical protein
VIISSDDEHESHFLIPGFFKTITDNSHNGKEDKPSSPVQDKEQSEVSDKPSVTTQPSSPPPPPQSQQSNTPSSTEQQKPNEPPLSSQSQQQNGSSSSPPPPATASTEEKKPDSSQSVIKQSSSTSESEVSKPSTAVPLANQQQNALPSQLQKVTLQQEDESIRRLLRYYNIDDGDIVEVAGGSLQRLVLIHPERPLPPYIQQNKQLLQKLQPGLYLTYLPIEINAHCCMN